MLVDGFMALNISIVSVLACCELLYNSLGEFLIETIEQRIWQEGFWKYAKKLSKKIILH